MDLKEATQHLQAVGYGDLTGQLALLELTFRGQLGESATKLCEQHNITDTALQAALIVKAAAGQVNVLIHALGILIALSHILEQGERVENLSLGAGNTGREFDLETSHRVAEFKFIHWRGGAESIRQNGLFKDFFYLAESETPKKRYLYLLGLDHPLRFLNGGRSLASILTKDQGLRDVFQARYGDQFSVVRDYYLHRRASVELRDLTDIVPTFAGQQ